MASHKWEGAGVCLLIYMDVYEKALILKDPERGFRLGFLFIFLFHFYIITIVTLCIVSYIVYSSYMMIMTNKDWLIDGQKLSWFKEKDSELTMETNQDTIYWYFYIPLRPTNWMWIFANYSRFTCCTTLSCEILKKEGNTCSISWK